MASDASIQTAVAAAWPRQALALTIAHWELTTGSGSLLGSLSATLNHEPITPTAGSLLMLANLTSKASCAVQQPLPDQAMDAWQHATWPTGDTELLCMSMVMAAEQHLQSIAGRFGKSQSSNPGQAAGKLQQAVSAAALLLTQMAVCVSEAMKSASDADTDDEVEGVRQKAQSEGLHPAVVGAMATRLYQLSDGNCQAAMVLLVASVLPEWELGLSESGQVGTSLKHNGPSGPIIVLDGEEEEVPATRVHTARQYRKRARSLSRLVDCMSALAATFQSGCTWLCCC